jgi:hypothetical protein
VSGFDIGGVIQLALYLLREGLLHRTSPPGWERAFGAIQRELSDFTNEDWPPPSPDPLGLPDSPFYVPQLDPGPPPPAPPPFPSTLLEALMEEVDRERHPRRPRWPPREEEIEDWLNDQGRRPEKYLPALFDLVTHFLPKPPEGPDPYPDERWLTEMHERNFPEFPDGGGGPGTGRRGIRPATGGRLSVKWWPTITGFIGGNLTTRGSLHW